jgi:hypothetical protein
MIDPPATAGGTDVYPSATPKLAAFAIAVTAQGGGNCQFSLSPASGTLSQTVVP